jgi:hypothetical protein
VKDVSVMSAPRPDLPDFHAQLGYKQLSRTWAKVEIVLGLGAAGAGLLAGMSGAIGAPTEWGQVSGGWGLFVLGAYLAMAGHRSHLYQSANEHTSYLAALIRATDRVPPHEHPR